MKSIAAHRPAIAADALLLATIAAVALVGGQSMAAQSHPEIIGPAVVFDLTVTAGLLHYFLGVRKGGLPRWTLGVVVGSGALLSVAILSRSLLAAAHLSVVIPLVIEAALVSAALLRIPTVLRAFAAKRHEGGPMRESLEAALAAALPAGPGLARWAVLEGMILVYALTGWFRKTPTSVPSDNVQRFSHHRKQQWTALALTFALLSCVEGGLVHLLLVSNGYWTAAWVAGFLHVMGILWLLGDMHAIRLRPSRIDNNTFLLTLGFRADANIPFEVIASAEVGTFPRSEISKDAAAVVLFGTPNVRLRLREPTLVRVLFRQRFVDEVYLQVDAPQALCRALRPAPEV